MRRRSSDRHGVTQFLDRVDLELPDSLGGDAEFVSELVQRHLGFREPALIDNPTAAVVKDVERGDARGAEQLSQLIIRAMISAAKADGQIDTSESQTILNQINGLALPADDLREHRSGIGVRAVLPHPGPLFERLTNNAGLTFELLDT